MRSDPPQVASAWLDAAGQLAAAPGAQALVAATEASRAPEAQRAPQPRYAERIAVRSADRIVIVALDDVVRLEADDNHVRIWTDRMHLHKETLTGLCARLDPARFLRIHRSHAVSLRVLRELRPRSHGEFGFLLADGTELRSGRAYRRQIETALGLA